MTEYERGYRDGLLAASHTLEQLKGLPPEPLENIKELAGKSKTIERVVCEYFDTSAQKLRQKTRQQEIVYPRQMFVYFLMTRTSMGCAAIGRVLLRDHTTILNNKKRIDDLLFCDDKVKNDVREITELLNQALVPLKMTA
jgi:chromosomal replication initiation ATPase DnaA